LDSFLYYQLLDVRQAAGCGSPCGSIGNTLDIAAYPIGRTSSSDRLARRRGEIMLSPQGEAMGAEFWENYHASFDAQLDASRAVGSDS
jgi:altronate dehydratase